MRPPLASLLFALVALVFAVAPGSIGAAPHPHADDEVLVRFAPGVSAAAKNTIHGRIGGHRVKGFSVVSDLELVKLPKGVAVKDAIKHYQKHSDVLYAEPNYVVRALLGPPDPGPDEVVARPVAGFEEYLQAAQLDEEVFGFPEEDRRAWEEHRRALWELQESGRSPVYIYVGYLDGELVGVGRSLRAAAGVNLSGGSVRPEARGRGVYRALVRARWDDAVAWGTPALTVQAGRMIALGFNANKQAGLRCP